MAARVLTTLMNILIEALGEEIAIACIKYWLDSKTTLYWVQNNGEWKQFFQHGVNEIVQ